MAGLKDKVEVFLKEALEENKNLFLVDWSVNENNQIWVIIDGDENVSIADCVQVSRKIEHQLDRDEVDFSVEVASPGLSEPLKMPRQFIKNIGRKLEVTTQDNNNIKADLVAADQQGIKLTWKTREPKPVGKGKHTVQKEQELSYDEIKEAKVMVIFNKK
ncbi:MAG: ribosome assembly cofactor RimP [Bacteroidota bacterium]